MTFGNLDFISALLGSIAALVGVLLSMWWQTHLRVVEAREQLVNTLDAFSTEIHVVWDRYMAKVGNEIEKMSNTDALYVYTNITQNYFSVYDHNTAIIGQIKDARLRTVLVSLYNDMKSHVDNLRYHDQCYNAYLTLRVKSDYTPCEIKNINQDLVSSSQTLKEEYALMRKKTDEFDALLAAYKKNLKR